MKKIKRKITLFLALVMLLTVSVHAESNNFINSEIPPEVAEENAPTYTLKHKIYIENYANGAVSYVSLSGKYTVIGTV